ncbi:MAG TPA: hypothetical protein VEI96_08435 [Thermodesulfovibrionales bacterium]|nr:hypothetical protein [Thermodesulfovibrionales bacterium]
MIQYRIVHHIPGRIRIEIPSIKGVSLKKLKDLAAIPVPSGIEGMRPNPLTGSLLIEYNPKEINIVKYLNEMAVSRVLEDKLIAGDPHE